MVFQMIGHGISNDWSWYFKRLLNCSYWCQEQERVHQRIAGLKTRGSYIFFVLVSVLYLRIYMIFHGNVDIESGVMFHRPQAHF